MNTNYKQVQEVPFIEAINNLAPAGGNLHSGNKNTKSKKRILAMSSPSKTDLNLHVSST